jgi:hypothetical protein
MRQEFIIPVKVVVDVPDSKLFRRAIDQKTVESSLLSRLSNSYGTALFRTDILGPTGKGSISESINGIPVPERASRPFSVEASFETPDNDDGDSDEFDSDEEESDEDEDEDEDA